MYVVVCSRTSKIIFSDSSLIDGTKFGIIDSSAGREKKTETILINSLVSPIKVTSIIRLGRRRLVVQRYFSYTVSPKRFNSNALSIFLKFFHFKLNTLFY